LINIALTPEWFLTVGVASTVEPWQSCTVSSLGFGETKVITRELIPEATVMVADFLSSATAASFGCPLASFP
jgi:hypothetical protein